MKHWKNLGTQGRIEAIREVWFRGCSSSQIAANFSDATRNSIIGVYNRYGVSHLADWPLTAKSPINKAFGERKKRAVRSPMNFQPPLGSKPLPDPRKVATEYSLCGKPLMMVEANECRWPVNDAEVGEVHLFCAMPSEGVYCSHHMLRGTMAPRADNAMKTNGKMLVCG